VTVLFHAPMKPPDHPVPSGDRQLARHLMRALVLAGFPVSLASRFTSFDATGDRDRQRRLAAAGRAEAEALIRRHGACRAATRPRLWFTYHLYHKAPDHLGPAVARALAIPYVVAEASSAAKQASGPWALGHAAAAAALAVADRVLQLNPGDVAGVEPLLADPSVQVGLPPFIDTRPFAAAAAARGRCRQAVADRYRLDPGRVWLVTAAMMRPGAKLEGYRQLAQALARLDGAAALPPWTLLVAGDGPARPEVEAALAPLGDGVRRLGLVAAADLPALFAAADLCVWPAAGEAIGLVLLEAAAAGLAVVAGHTPGVAAVVADGVTGLLTDPGDGEAFAAAVARLLADPPRRRRLGEAAARRAAADHGLAAAARHLARHLAPLTGQPVADGPMAAAPIAAEGR
jgi:glycosyltransferase involved in cell wall biosynthesis